MSFVNDFAAAQDDEPVGERGGEPDVLLGDDERHAERPQPADCAYDLVENDRRQPL
jgi:hypothetical protein